MLEVNWPLNDHDQINLPLLPPKIECAVGFSYPRSLRGPTLAYLQNQWPYWDLRGDIRNVSTKCTYIMHNIFVLRLSVRSRSKSKIERFFHKMEDGNFKKQQYRSVTNIKHFQLRSYATDGAYASWCLPFKVTIRSWNVIISKNCINSCDTCLMGIFRTRIRWQQLFLDMTSRAWSWRLIQRLIQRLHPIFLKTGIQVIWTMVRLNMALFFF